MKRRWVASTLLTILRSSQRPAQVSRARCYCQLLYTSARIPSRQHPLVTLIHIRGAKRKSRVSLMDLGQGALPLEPLHVPPQEALTYPTVIAQVKQNMEKFPNCVVLTRVGGFYELYFEHARDYGPLLNLKVIEKKTSAGPVAMAGFPYFQLDRILKILVQEQNCHVALSEEYPNPERSLPGSSSYGLQHDRRIARIITPGTLIDEKFIDPFDNNFILCIHAEEQPRRPKEDDVGLAWLDLSTGDFYLQQSTLSALSSDVTRIGPREIILSECIRQHDIVKLLQENQSMTTLAPANKTMNFKSWHEYIDSEKSVPDDFDVSVSELTAGSTLLEYVKDQLQGLSLKLQPPVRRKRENNMLIDTNSMRALEIKTTLREGIGGGKGTLLKEIRRTVTKGGARRLATWLTSPEISVKLIDGRLNLVDCFLQSPDLLKDVQHQLLLSHDTQRLVQKLSLGRGDADELVALARTIEATHALVQILTAKEHFNQDDGVFAGLLSRINAPTELANLILKSIDEEGLMLSHHIENMQAAEMVSLAKAIEGTEIEAEDEDEAQANKKRKDDSPVKARPRSTRMLKEAHKEKLEAWIMRRTASKLLSKLHKDLDLLNDEQLKLEEDLREETGAQTLSLRWTPNLGHICHIKGKNRILPQDGRFAEAKSVGSSKSTHSFHLPVWTHLGSTIEMARLAIRAEEQKVLLKLKKEVIMKLAVLRRNAAVLDELDIACGFAVLAKEKNLVRPILNSGTKHTILGGRHLVVEAGLALQGKSFTTNDCDIGGKEQIWIITGPNMAGKSTFLRQNALISILAQTGSFVPANYAEIGIVDQIFSRVGSADNLYKDQSTFMVEMMETSVILKRATPRSFVIMDEVGRGTTPTDGLAIAYACIHHLHNINQSRVLFATHFHDLADMSAERLDRVGMYCTDVVELDGGRAFSYVHRLKQGVNRQSHALKVARLAGLPDEAIEVAQDVLKTMDDGNAAVL